METLSDRFNALQDKLMDIYESGQDDLETQILHWKYLREEQVLLYYARKNGIMRLGYQLVPPLATSEAKAKDAIGMMLLLQSLQRSPYASESWTLMQTSLEAVRSPPANCFKKGPYNIEVMYDSDPENLMSYTLWSFIYYQRVDDTWNKVEGHVDYNGAYYYEGNLKTYYIEFESDAARYGKTGQWEVHVNKDTIFAPVTSTSPGTGGGDSDQTSVHSVSRASPTVARRSASPLPTRTTTQRTRTRSRTESRRYQRKESSPTATATRQQKRQREEETNRRSRSSSRGQEADWGGDRRRRREGDSSTRSDSSNRARGGRSGGRPRTRSQSRSKSRSRSRGPSTRRGVSPAEVGASVRSVGRRHHDRLERLLDEAKDPPVVLLRGAANTLKCYRYRAKKKYSALVKYFSTTWSWVGGENNDRVGRARMLLAFSSNTQRELFLKVMKLPPNVDWSLGSLDDL